MQLPEAFRCLPRPSSALKPSHPPDGVACRAYSVTLQCLFSVGNAYLACVRFSLRADKSSLHPLLLTVRSGVASFCGDLFDHFVIAKYVEHKTENISIAVMGSVKSSVARSILNGCKKSVDAYLYNRGSRLNEQYL
jgi:hypothetical protein